jgi:autotransporter-associated beta strand protein
VGSVPNSVSATANLGGAASTDANLSRTITLDAAQTIGTLNLTSPHGESYTLTAGSGGSLTFNNGGLGSALISVSGTHTLDSTVAVNLSSNLSISTGAGTDSLTIGGTVANTNTGTLAATVTVSGPGTVSLLGANTYGPASAGTVGTNINGGTVAVGANTSLGAGDVSVGGAVSVKSAAAGLNLANNFILGNSDSVAFDSNGNTLTVSGVVSDTSANGSLIAKSTIGGGTVVLANTETFGGSVTVNANTTLLLTAAQSYGGTTTISPTATLEVGNGGSTGALPATTTALTDSGALIFDRTDVNTITVANPISGNGSVTQNGVTGNTISLTGANSYSGGTTINGGEIQNGNATALGSGDLSIASGATLDLDGNGATIGNLNGAGTITSSAAGTMIVSLGNDNSSGLFTGTIANGTGTSVGISKFGSGTEQIGSGTTGGALYTGPTLVEQATLIIGGTSSITGSVDVGAENGTSALTIQDNAVIVDSTALEICSDDGSADGGEANGNPGGSTLLITGTANVTATGLAIGNVSGATPSRVGSSTITINDLATVTINGIFTLDNTEGTTGSTNVINLNGGILGVDNIVLGFANGTSQTAVIHLNGTTLEALASDPNASVFLPGVAGITVDVDSGGAIINTEGHTDTIATTLSAGTGGGLTKQGAGTLILTGAANYTGATAVNGGTLVVKGAMSATSGVTVAAGATLEADASINGADVVNDTAGGNIDGTGTIGGANITGGTLSPGLSTGSTVVGTLTSSNNISLSGNSTFAVRLGLTTGASTDVDSLNDTGGTFTLADTTTTLQINDTTVEYGATPGTLYDIIIGAVNAPVGVFGNALASGDTITTANNDVFAVYYDVNGSNVGTAGNDDVLELIAVPEPGTWASLLGGIGMLVAWQRTRRRRS